LLSVGPAQGVRVAAVSGVEAADLVIRPHATRLLPDLEVVVQDRSDQQADGDDAAEP
jgi:hypothetical protein